MYYQTKLIKNHFPNSQHIIIDGRKNWPYSWFYWINEIKKTECDYFIHVDEDFFLLSREELDKCIQKMEDDNIDIMGVPDGYHKYRGANPVAINSFLMIGRRSILGNINLDDIRFQYNQLDGWINNKGLKFKNDYKSDFKYPFNDREEHHNFYFEQEPYYAFLWSLKENGAKIGYLFAHFDDRFKSTNPRLDESSPDIGIHMWYTRQWNSTFDVHGISNIERYNRVEKFLIDEWKLQ